MEKACEEGDGIVKEARACSATLGRYPTANPGIGMEQRAGKRDGQIDRFIRPYLG